METRWNRLFLQRLISILRNSSTKNIVLFIEFFIFGPQSDYNKREEDQRSPIILIITFKQIIRPFKTVTSCSTRKGFVLLRMKEYIREADPHRHYLPLIKSRRDLFLKQVINKMRSGGRAHCKHYL